MDAVPLPLRGAVEALCRSILVGNQGLQINLKWNAPNFHLAGEDRVTFRFPPKGGAQLVFHRGSKVKPLEKFRFADPTGLLVWAAPDRAVLKLPEASWSTVTTAVVELVGQWVHATRTDI